MSKIKDSDIRMNCPDKATCYEHLHNLEVLKAYRKECKLSKKYFACLQEIKEIAEYSIMHNDNLNSNYQLILQLITKAEEEWKF